MLKGEEVVAFPVSVPPPLLVTVKVRVLLLPTPTVPKSREAGDTESMGGFVPLPVRLTLAVPPLLLTLTLLPLKVPAPVGLKRTVTV